MSSRSLQKASIANFDQQFGVPVCGIDEVGRGPLAGPVVSACVFIPEENLDNPIWQNITDSKKISTMKREKLFEPIKELCVYGIAEATCQEIDQLNIHHATLLAMKRAYLSMLSFRRSEAIGGILSVDGHLRSLDYARDDILALIDGKFAPKIACKTQTVIKGDNLSLSIGAASILAKVTRDRLMAQLHRIHPHYGWDRNAGYGTKIHMEGLKTHGITPHHRLSFAPCAAIKKQA
ncbi:MAG TPA: ribonuclease HII [Alphaproteobacteria bacterium]|nr:ribonuclease HII [Alphaproteobacteria bacterium]